MRRTHKRDCFENMVVTHQRHRDTVESAIVVLSNKLKQRMNLSQRVVHVAAGLNHKWEFQTYRVVATTEHILGEWKDLLMVEPLNGDIPDSWLKWGRLSVMTLAEFQVLCSELDAFVESVEQ